MTALTNSFAIHQFINEDFVQRSIAVLEEPQAPDNVFEYNVRLAARQYLLSYRTVLQGFPEQSIGIRALMIKIEALISKPIDIPAVLSGEQHLDDALELDDRDPIFWRTNQTDLIEELITHDRQCTCPLCNGDPEL